MVSNRSEESNVEYQKTKNCFVNHIRHTTMSHKDNSNKIVLTVRGNLYQIQKPWLRILFATLWGSSLTKAPFINQRYYKQSHRCVTFWIKSSLWYTLIQNRRWATLIKNYQEKRNIRAIETTLGRKPKFPEYIRRNNVSRSSSVVPLA